MKKRISHSFFRQIDFKPACFTLRSFRDFCFAGFRQKLPLFLARTAKDWSSLEGRHTDWEFLTRAAKADALLPSAMTLEKLGSHNIELIRSFSFVGEVDLPPDPATHQVSLQIQEPVRISQHEPGGK